MRLLALRVSAILYVAIFSGPGQFTITSVSIGACNDIIKVTYMEVSHVTIYSNYIPCMTLWYNVLQYLVCPLVYLTVCDLSTAPVYVTSVSE